ncbi:hypothetical protein [Undibacterium sp.]|uniref:hypothetical protein n=1 Tax=Undibacterium sp. TaxID=1914977 RepID=UPI0027321E1D|nr:hypothetical protein [Undibacterium sp.]MDP1980312.1 hypothetical protein [Undibacterium sp.]
MNIVIRFVALFSYRRSGMLREFTPLCHATSAALLHFFIWYGNISIHFEITEFFTHFSKLALHFSCCINGKAALLACLFPGPKKFRTIIDTEIAPEFHPIYFPILFIKML